LAPDEFRALLTELPHRERVMVLLAGTTGLRRSELIALKWHDVDFGALQISVNKSCVRGQLGETKTLASARPIPIHEIVGDALREWQQSSPYRAPDDFLFPSLRNNGSIPVWPDMILQKTIRPALDRARIRNKRVGWHTFRRSVATTLQSMGVDVKVTQELLGHANSRITLDLYTQAIPAQKREACSKLVEMLLVPEGGSQNQHPSAPPEPEEVFTGGPM
jgi:integrase